ncbi:MAG: glycosyltransferase family 9 protein [Rhodocyclales bacterium]|nr:glycosyltransferase family 9 protein [Rhodocyclales bacterium]
MKHIERLVKPTCAKHETRVNPMKRPRRILLVCPQRIGDVLLATPLAHSLKLAWPDAQVDMLVFADTQGVIEGNADITTIIPVPRRASWREQLMQVRRLWRKYDIALSPIPTDRARLYCWAAARRRYGMRPTSKQGLAKQILPRLLLNQTLVFDDLDTHTVAMGLQLTALLGIPPSFTVTPPSVPATQAAEKSALSVAFAKATPYVVLHPYPKFAYKMWTHAAWVSLARWCVGQGRRVIFTGGPDADECAYVKGIVADSVTNLAGDAVSDIVNLAGTLSLAQTAQLIRGATLYVGPDTAVTHIAAATGTPTIALFGPSNPVKWGPLPHDWKQFASPWRRVGSARQGNVHLVQGQAACVPCLLEGCGRQVNSTSDCLQHLPVATVITAAQAFLNEQAS